MEYINNWLLMEDGCVFGTIIDCENGSAHLFKTDVVIDITSSPGGMPLLETENYYCELGDPKGKCLGCGHIGPIDDESLLCYTCDPNISID